MSKQHSTSAHGQRDEANAPPVAPTTSVKPSPRQGSAYPLGLAHTGRSFLLVLALMLPIAVTIFAITFAGVLQGRRMSTAPLIQPSVSVRAAITRIFKVYPPGAGLMLPAVDLQGNVWFGEMGTNRLARLNARTGTLTSWIPPRGEDGIMGITVDHGGNVWFAEENANYIGRFDPVRQAFSIFSLGHNKSERVGLEDVQFDSTGNLWFTETIAGGIGRLDPARGTFHSWVLPPSAPGVPSSPFGLAVTPWGQVWFGTYSGGVVGRLNPKTGHVSLYHLANPAEQIYSLAVDARGRIWYSELQFGKLGMIDPTTGRVSERGVPATLGTPEDLHSIVVAHGDIWLTSSGANALVRYSPDQHAFTFFRLSVSGSTPFGLALGPADTLWFTAGGNPINYIGAMKIPS